MDDINWHRRLKKQTVGVYVRLGGAADDCGSSDSYVQTCHAADEGAAVVFPEQSFDFCLLLFCILSCFVERVASFLGGTVWTSPALLAWPQTTLQSKNQYAENPIASFMRLTSFAGTKETKILK